MLPPGGCISHVCVSGSRSEMRPSSFIVSASYFTFSPGASAAQEDV
jgi:hypothetical protein